MANTVRTIVARDLLNGFLELRGLTPDIGAWSEQGFAGNPPRLIRLQRLRAVFRAFGLDWDPVAFMEGRFIQPDDSRYAALLERVGAENPKATAFGLGPKGHQLPKCFAILFQYRERVEAVLSFSSGVLEASGMYAYAHRKAGELNRVIHDNIAIVDDILIAFISPEAKRVTVEELTRDHGYPDVNLSEIDSDWW